MAFPDEIYFGTNMSVWPTRWVAWPWSEIQAEIDLCHALGFNCIRMFGDIASRLEGDMTLGDYTSRWNQFLDYCATKDIYVYVAGGVGQWIGMNFGPGDTFDPFNSFEPTDQQIADQIAETVTIVDSHQAVIAYDLINEIFDNSYTHGGVDFAQKLWDASSTETSKSITLSRIMSADADFSDDTWFGYTFCQHIDNHIYYPGAVQGSSVSPLPAASGLLTAQRALFPNRPICVSEFGANNTVTNRHQYYQQILHNWTPQIGVYPMCMNWAIIDYPDQPVAESFVYGLYEDDRVTPYAEIIKTFNARNPVLVACRSISGSAAPK